MTEVCYSIKDLENFTQIKAHTIRIWEQRYGLLSPKRTKTNIRYYSEDDLKKILNINLLYTSGYKISKIASLTEAEIFEESKKRILEKELNNQSEIDKLTLHILSFNGEKIHAYFEDALKESTMEDLYQTIVMPILKKLGELWQVNSINIFHEHYFSSIFKEFIVSHIYNLNLKSKKGKVALLFLHDNEEHEFSILLYYYILKKAGYSCHYLGQKQPVHDLKGAIGLINPQLIVTTFTTKISERKFLKIQEELLSLSDESEVIISGSQLNNFDFDISQNLNKIDSINQLNEILKS